MIATKTTIIERIKAAFEVKPFTLEEIAEITAKSPQGKLLSREIRK
jgi:hypothetical protein